MPRFTLSLAASFANFIAEQAPDLAVWLVRHRGQFETVFTMAGKGSPPQAWPDASSDELAHAAQIRAVLPLYMSERAGGTEASSCRSRLRDPQVPASAAGQAGEGGRPTGKPDARAARNLESARTWRHLMCVPIFKNNTRQHME